MKTRIVLCILIFNILLAHAQVTDIDGNTYKTVIIGKQEWMAENLRVNQYSNGDAIHFLDVGEILYRGSDGFPDDFDEMISDLLPVGGTYTYYYLWGYSHIQHRNLGGVYGYLYNLEAVTDQRNVCPQGWKVPSTSDWNHLIDYLGGDSLAPKKMSAFSTWKEVEESYHEKWGYEEYGYSKYHYWSEYITTENIDSMVNQSGFSALPGGRLHSTYSPNGIRSAGYWWALPTEGDESFNTIAIGYRFDRPISKLNVEESSLSVRCLKDN